LTSIENDLTWQNQKTLYVKMKKPKRRLAAIMFTDIVGYSAMMQKDEIIANRFRNRHREVFTRLTKEYGGKIIQYFGDGTLSVYPSAAAAVECGVAIQKELKQEPAVSIRVGIHTGDITYNEEEAYGDGVNVAARIESLSIPGGVFISEKVYDDIKNHSWLKTQFLGAFDLKNIQEDIRVYAVNNQGITAPEPESVPVPQNAIYKNPLLQQTPGKRKRKFASGLLAFFFGIFGAHRFYLGQRNLGILYLSISLTAMFIITSLGNLVGMMAIISLIDAVLLWSMSRENFDAKYNQAVTTNAQADVPTNVRTKKMDQTNFLATQFDAYFQKAKRNYQDEYYEEAIENLVKAVEIRYDEPEVQFLLARCFSILEKTEKAFSHLDAAIAFGLKDINRINEYADMAYLRMQPEFDAFVNNNNRLPEEIPSQRKEMPPLPKDTDQAQSVTDTDLLEQLNKLHMLYEEGLLTESEYLKQEETLKSGER
jgi:class 3 adenylate cyclase/TM2 domain-containing membrane protein YozV